MTKFKCITLFLCAAFSTAAMAEDFVRDGRPCLSGVCIGDEISTLAGVKWQPASHMGLGGNPIPLNLGPGLKGRVIEIQKNLPPSEAKSAGAIAPYIMFNSFDGKAIQKLSKVKGFCHMIPYGLIGSLISDSGHKTRVTINVVPGADPSSQSLRVTEITRVFPRQGFTEDQINNLANQLEERYKGVKESSTGSMTEPTFHVGGNFNSELELNLRAARGVSSVNEMDAKLMAYPGCSKALTID